jgi:hypothetical protein
MASSQRITEITWESADSTMRLRRPGPGVVVLAITGTDVGEHGAAPFEELENDVRQGAVSLFVDAKQSRGVTIEVSAEWCRWLAQHRSALRSVHILTGSTFVHITAKLVRNFGELGDLMRIYTDASAFEQTLAAELDRSRR